MTRNFTLDCLKIALAVSVVFLHSHFLSDVYSLGSHLLVNGLFRAAVPIFLIINGYFFYSALTNKSYLRWLKKLLILYLIWMTVYSVYWFSYESLSFANGAKLIHRLLIGYHHLWYLIGTFEAALLFVLVKHFSDQRLIYFTIFCFAAGVFIQYSGNYHLFESPALDRLANLDWTHRNFLFLCFPFFAIGALINQRDLVNKISVSGSRNICLIGFLLLFSESTLNFFFKGEGGFDNLISLIVICPGIFLMAMQLKSFSKKWNDLALYSTGIYLVHTLFININKDYFQFDATLLAFTVLASSIVASYALIKLKKHATYIL